MCIIYCLATSFRGLSNDGIAVELGADRAISVSWQTGRKSPNHSLPAVSHQSLPLDPRLICYSRLYLNLHADISQCEKNILGDQGDQIDEVL